MEKLTIELVKEKHMTPFGCVRYFEPDWTNEECDFFIWEKTCYPFSTETFIQQLNDHFIGLNLGI